jgi:arylsulfatase A-like enzyme
MGILEACWLQNPVRCWTFDLDRSVYFFAFLSYGLVGWILFRVLRFFFPNFNLPRSIGALGLVALLTSAVYGFVPSYRFATHHTANSSLPSIVVITLDTLRADHLGCYGYAKPTSPFLDSLAHQGTLFRNAYTVATWTLPAHTSLFTGMMPTVHGADWNHFFVSSANHMLAEILQEQGYSTGAFISGPFLSSSFNINQGFEYYNEDVDPHSKLSRLTLFRILQTILHKKLWKVDGQRRAEEVNQQLFPYLEWAQHQKPFFVFINYFDAHEPYDPPEAYRELFHAPAGLKGNVRQFSIDRKTGLARYHDGPPLTQAEFDGMIALYDGEIRYLDDQFKLMWEQMERLHLLDNTLVVITADHGESIGEHGFLDHGHNLYQEQIHVPLIVIDSRLGEGKSVEQPVEITDVFPTVLEAVKLPMQKDLQGRSLFHAADQPVGRSILAEIDSDPYPRFTAFRRDQRMLMQQEIKFIASSDGKNMLFDLSSDPAELANLVQEKEAQAQQMYQQVTGIFQTLAKYRLRGTGELDNETRERLKALGYVAE